MPFVRHPHRGELARAQQLGEAYRIAPEQQIKDLAAQERIPYSHIIIDEDGVGGGVVDHLQGVKGFTANSVAIPTDS